MDPITLLLVFGVFAVAMYFLMIRPQKKRMEEQQKTINTLAPGTRVLLGSGIFATLREVGERQMIVELAPGVEVAIVKQAVARPANPDEEEFEFTDPAEPHQGEASDRFDSSSGFDAGIDWVQPNSEANFQQPSGGADESLGGSSEGVPSEAGESLGGSSEDVPPEAGEPPAGTRPDFRPAADNPKQEQ